MACSRLEVKQKTPNCLDISKRIMVTFTSAKGIFDSFEKKRAERGEKNRSALLEFLMECYIQESCESCPYFKEEAET